MGNYITSDKQLTPKHKAAIKRLKNLRLFDVHEVFQDYVQNYRHLHALKWAQFDEIFSPLLNNTVPIFELLQDREQVEIRQALIGLTIFSIGDFDDKLFSLFSAFDLSGTGSIDRKELSIFITDAIMCLCKIVGMQPPSRFQIQEFTYSAFDIVDADGNGIIDRDEFYSWIKGCDNIQDFLLKHTGIQTHERATRRYQLILAEWRRVFKEVAIEYCGTQYVEMALLRKRMEQHMSEMDKDIREKIYSLLNYGGREIISEEDFEAIISPMAVFSAADINNTNELDIRDLKILLWLYEGKEPTPMRVQQEMANIDIDGSGTLDRMEFIKFLVSGQDGDEFFDYELRKKFDLFDSDRNGSISVGELISFLNLELKPSIKKVSEKEEHLLPDIIQDLAVECVEALYEKVGRKVKVTDKTEITWTLFKNINQICRKKIAACGDYIEHYLKESTKKPKPAVEE